MKKIAAIGFALLMVFAVFVPFASANAGDKETKGYLYVDLACRSPQISGEFTATPVIVSAPFTNAARVDKGFVDVYVKKVGEPVTFKFLPQGQFDTQAEPGTYLLQMEDANGGQPEYALVTIKVGFKETVVFLGHGITPADEPKAAEPVFVITEAKYGAFRTELLTPEVPAVPGVDAYYEHTSDPATVPCVHFHAAVPAVPAVDAYYEHANDGVDVPAHTEYAPAIGHSHYAVTDYKFFGYTLKVKCTNHAEHGEGYHVQTAACTAEYNYVYGAFTDTQPTSGVYQTRTVEATYKPCVHFHAAVPAVPGVDAYYEHTSDPATVPCVHFHAAVPAVPAVPAVYHQVGYFVDVTAKVQAAVDAGVQNIVFNNAANPGGIFDTEGHLLQQITDPLYGTLKTATIKYTVDGGAEKTASGQEHQTISIV